MCRGEVHVCMCECVEGRYVHVHVQCVCVRGGEVRCVCVSAQRGGVYV